MLLCCRVEYMEKSKNLQDQLRELKTEIEVLKIEDNSQLLDRLHDENVSRGDTKYSTLRQVPYLTKSNAEIKLVLKHQIGQILT